MADYLCFYTKDGFILKAPKTTPLALRLIVLILTMLCGCYICWLCIKQISFSSNLEFSSFQKLENPCPVASIKPGEGPYVHYPKPKTYSRYFAILSVQRSGSGWFETLLNNHTNISSNGEIFSVKIRRSNISTITETLDRIYNLDWSSTASKNECSAAFGLKWMLNQGLIQHHEEIVDYFRLRRVLVIFLFRRNLLRRMVSILGNSYDREAKPLNGTHKSHVHSPSEAKILALYKPTINTSMLISNMMQVKEMTAKALESFKSTRHIVLYYEDIIKNRTKLNDVQDFLKVPRMDLKSQQVKIHKGALSNQIENWDEVRNALQGTLFETFLYS